MRNHCAVAALENYLDLVKPIREANDSTQLYITTAKPYKSASKDTLARWIKTTIHQTFIRP